MKKYRSNLILNHNIRWLLPRGMSVSFNKYDSHFKTIPKNSEKSFQRSMEEFFFYSIFSVSWHLKQIFKGGLSFFFPGRLQYNSSLFQLPKLYLKRYMLTNTALISMNISLPGNFITFNSFLIFLFFSLSFHWFLLFWVKFSSSTIVSHE